VLGVLPNKNATGRKFTSCPCLLWLLVPPITRTQIGQEAAHAGFMTGDRGATGAVGLVR
jgi:hypothetical protein